MFGTQPHLTVYILSVAAFGPQGQWCLLPTEPPVACKAENIYCLTVHRKHVLPARLICKDQLKSGSGGTGRLHEEGKETKKALLMS